MSVIDNSPHKLTKKGSFLMNLGKQDARIAHPVTFTRIINDPISGWLFEQLFLFTYAEKLNESDIETSVKQENSCLTNLFYWQEYGKVAVLREGVTTETVYTCIVEHL